MISDAAVKELIEIALKEEQDIFLRQKSIKAGMLAFDDVPSVVFLPSQFFGAGMQVFSHYTPDHSFALPAARAENLYADIRFLGDASFRAFLIKGKYKRIILPFAECALKGEYLYRASFSWLGEFRAECPYFVQLLALFPECDYDFEELRSIFGSKAVCCLGRTDEPKLNVFEASSPKGKFCCVADEAEKLAWKKTAVYFNSRSETEEFGRFLDRRRVDFVLYDGNLSDEERLRAFRRFNENESPIVIATRSFIPETLFTDVEKSIFAGVPFSVSHIHRCCASTSEIDVIYCPSDFERNERISRSLSDTVGDSEIYTVRSKNLSEIQRLIKE